MKKYLILLALTLELFLNPLDETHAQDHTAVEFNLFFDALAPYGEWLWHPAFGYVWRPIKFEPDWRDYDQGNWVWSGYGWVLVSPEGHVLSPVLVEPDWSPYKHGHWVWSDYGWTWFSYEPWGWATDHYGRWAFTRDYGWVWIPGTVWGPAWVTWYMADDYIGWAPLPPDPSFFMEIGIGYSFSYYSVYAFPHYSVEIPPSHCVFVQSGHFLDTNVKEVVVPSSYNVTIIKRTKKIINVNVMEKKVINYGPDVRFVEKVTKVKVKKIKVIDRDADENISVKQIGRINKLEKDRFYIFRPQVIKRGNEAPSFKEKWKGPEKFKHMKKWSKPQREVVPESENTFSKYKIKEFHKDHKGWQEKKEMKWKPHTEATTPVEEKKAFDQDKRKWKGPDFQEPQRHKEAEPKPHLEIIPQVEKPLDPDKGKWKERDYNKGQKKHKEVQQYPPAGIIIQKEEKPFDSGKQKWKGPDFQDPQKHKEAELKPHLEIIPQAEKPLDPNKGKWKEQQPPAEIIMQKETKPFDQDKRKWKGPDFQDNQGKKKQEDQAFDPQKNKKMKPQLPAEIFVPKNEPSRDKKERDQNGKKNKEVQQKSQTNEQAPTQEKQKDQKQKNKKNKKANGSDKQKN
jgi:hypothetical protein